MMQILDATSHPLDASSVLNWMIRCWNADPQAHLLLITAKRDGSSWNNRLRVKLSVARTALKRQGIRNYQHFGMESSVFAWTLEDGAEREALHMQKIVHIRHTFADVFATHDINELTKKT